MTDEAWGFVGVALTALVGGSGLAGLLSGVVDLSRRSRLRRRIEKTAILRDLLPDGSPERSAVVHAVAMDSARLAALSTVGIKDKARDRLPVLVGIGVIYLAAMASLALLLPADWVLGFAYGLTGGVSARVGGVIVSVGVAVGSVLGLAFFNPRGVGQRRRAWVRAILNGTHPSEATKTAQE